jgi:hypothetical protein
MDHRKPESDPMPFERAIRAAGRDVISGAPIAELRAAASDLLASRKSAPNPLSYIVDIKVAELVRQEEQEHPNDMAQISVSGTERWSG